MRCAGDFGKSRSAENKKATVWQNISDKESIKILEKNGAEFINKDVVFDGKIITANGPAAAEKFGESILKLI